MPLEGALGFESVQEEEEEEQTLNFAQVSSVCLRVRVSVLLSHLKN